MDFSAFEMDGKSHAGGIQREKIMKDRGLRTLKLRHQIKDELAEETRKDSQNC